MDRNIHGSYGSLLFRPEWKAKRARILDRDEHRCIFCGSQDRLQVHHRQYHIDKSTGRKYAPWSYDDKYLVTVCKSCHERGHSKYEIPIKFI